ncbi:MAG: RnfABCDGE type electron transport complex subunit G [Deltaproteobacteria bacterium]|jgi:electron transport complex protein RnfG|nr:RnfABCDGE type electron transport complex subunit G [Deltaproteobacteria bacterium]
MRDMFKLFIVIVVFSVVSGGVLAAVRNATKDRIEYQQLVFVKGPAINLIMEGCANNPLQDRFKMKDKDKERDFFVGEFDGKKDVVAFETYGKGFGGDIGVITAVNVDTDKIVGVAVTTHSETPGVGARTKSDPDFRKQFSGQPITDVFKVKADGGQIDAVSGATISSRGVSAAVVQAGEIYKRLKNDLIKKMKASKG